MIVSRRHGLVIADYYFDEPLTGCRADVLRYNSWSMAVPSSRVIERWTILIDLGKDKERLWSGVDKNARNEIRRAERELVEARRWSVPGDSVIRDFADFFDVFAAQKNLSGVSRDRLKLLAANGCLHLSMACSGGAVMVWHAYVCAQGRARLLHSASQFRALRQEDRNSIGRANRYLHWADLLAFKESGYSVLDMGGWDSAGSEAVQRINDFKKKFGGSIAREFFCTRPCTVKGRVAVFGKALVERASAVHA